MQLGVLVDRTVDAPQQTLLFKVAQVQLQIKARLLIARTCHGMVFSEIGSHGASSHFVSVGENARPKSRQRRSRAGPALFACAENLTDRCAVRCWHRCYRTPHQTPGQALAEIVGSVAHTPWSQMNARDRGKLSSIQYVIKFHHT